MKRIFLTLVTVFWFDIGKASAALVHCESALITLTVDAAPTAELLPYFDETYQKTYGMVIEYGNALLAKSDRPGSYAVSLHFGNKISSGEVAGYFEDHLTLDVGHFKHPRHHCLPAFFYAHGQQVAHEALRQDRSTWDPRSKAIIDRHLRLSRDAFAHIFTNFGYGDANVTTEAIQSPTLPPRKSYANFVEHVSRAALVDRTITPQVATRESLGALVRAEASLAYRLRRAPERDPAESSIHSADRDLVLDFRIRTLEIKRRRTRLAGLSFTHAPNPGGKKIEVTVPNSSKLELVRFELKDGSIEYAIDVTTNSKEIYRLFLERTEPGGEGDGEYRFTRGSRDLAALFCMSSGTIMANGTARFEGDGPIGDHISLRFGQL